MDIIRKPQVSSNILKATLRTIIKLVDLKIQVTGQEIVNSLLACKYDCHDRDQEEVLLLTI